MESRRAVRHATKRNAILLRFKTHGVQNACAGGIAEINRLARCVERKAELRLVVGQKTARRNDRARRQDEFVHLRIVAQRTAGNVERLIAVIVKFDEIKKRWITVREKFIDDDIA